jgi:competence protein ComEC
LKGGYVLARRKNQKYPLWAVAAAALVCFLAGTFAVPHHAAGQESQAGSYPAQSAPANSGDTLVYFLDVGQGDCELIRLATGENILIDSGTSETAQKLVSCLNGLGVHKIDTLIATHPHEDHIGGMTQVIKAFEIGKIYMPRIADRDLPTTSVYETLLKEIDGKGLKITEAKGGMEIFESGKEKLEIFAPNSSKYTDLNNYSIVTKLTCGEKSFLFTGDAQAESEKEMIAKGYDIKSDVLKCGHHGSSTSTSAAFLKAVGPSAAVISCGVDNDYGHPNKEVLNRLQKAGVTVYRTDLQDTILARCDGKTVVFSTGQKSVIK